MKGTREKNLLELIWDMDEPDRFVKLAMHAPHLLAFEEEVKWKIIKTTSRYWEKEDKPNYELIQEGWNSIHEEANKKLLNQRGGK